MKIKNAHLNHVLWLPSWYPHEEEPLAGDFIERHARAAALHRRIVVLFVVKDHLKTAKKKTVRETVRYSGNLIAQFYYYRTTTRLRWLESLCAAFLYFRLYSKLIKEHFSEFGRPDLVHVHVGFRAGLIAWYLKWRYGLRYVISEHWSLFLSDARPSLGDKPFWIRALIRMIYRNASRHSAVSRHLAVSIAQKTGIAEPVVIPNVVNPEMFYPQKEQSAAGPFRFIHVSQLNYAKNPGQILEAIAILKRQTPLPFEVTIYGPMLPEIAGLVDTLEVADVVCMKGEVAQQRLAADLRRHDTLILYSRYEGLPCVVIEALASGLPVIVSDIPATREMVRHGVSGLIVPLDDPHRLASSMEWMMNNRAQFDSEVLATQAVEKYGVTAVAGQFERFYSF